MKKALWTVVALLGIVLALLAYVEHGKRTAPTPSAPSEHLPLGSASPELQRGEQGEEENEAVKVTFLDIGQGDASFIEFPDGEQMLVDCAKDARILSALGRVMPYYDHRIDYLVITHPDRDHYGGCVDVLKRFDVPHILYNGLKKDYDDYWRVFWSTIEEEHADYREVNKEEVWDVASTSLHFLFPDSPVGDQLSRQIQKDQGANNTSVVFTLEYGGHSILFTGDAEQPLEEHLISKYGKQLDVDILKVGHHGSDSSSEEPFIKMVSPTHSSISVGANNTYGHPSRRVLKKLERSSSTIWRTDLQGDIVATLSDTGMEVKAQGK